MLKGGPAVVSDRVRSAVSFGRDALRVIRDAGMLHPVRPDRALRLPLQFVRFGASPAVAGAAAALRWPDRPAVIDELGTLTFAELESRSAAQATALRRHLGEGEKVGILCRNHRGFVEAMLAGSRLGHDVVFLNTDFAAPQLKKVLANERIGVIVHDEEFSGVVAAASFTGTRVVAWHDGPVDHPTLDELAAGEAVPIVAGRGGKVVILTSGTTGPPKGASHDYGLAGIMQQSLGHLIRVPLRSGEPILVGPPLFHGLGLTYLLAALGLGSPVVLLRRFDPKDVLAAIELHAVDTFIAVPVMLARLLDVPESYRTSSLRIVLSGGAALHPNLAGRFIDRFGDLLYNAYGATETGWATIATPADLRAAPGTVGRPTLGVIARILSADGVELPWGEIGTLYLDSGLKFSGYTGGGTKHYVDGLISTGDLGHLDAEGRLFIDGRADDMIVSGGENVFPAEVEDLLEGHPGVAEVAVAGVEDEKFGQRLAAWVVRAEGSTVTEDDLKNHVKRRLARYKVPRDITFVNELPRTTTGKIKHGVLREG
jgi:acyl-CoA synthetase (AMP-forming)/AMP-acid ligase II